jgi:hypothetical protein
MKNYLTQLLVYLCVAGAIAFGFVYLVDPYDYWGHQKLGHIAEAKPEAAKHIVALKAQQYLRVKPKILIAGNSRSAVGIDPLAYQKASSKTVYNFGIPGFYVSTIVAQLEYLLPSHKPEKILIDLDYTDFPQSLQEWQQPDPNSPIFNYKPKDPLKLFIESNFSLSSLIDSGQTLLESRAITPRTVRPDGFLGMEWMGDSIKAQGVRSVFEMKQRLEQHLLIKKFKGRHVSWPNLGKNAVADKLEKFIELAKGQNIEVVLFMSPLHEQLDAEHIKLGLAAERLAFLKLISAMAARQHVKLYNFDTQSPFQRERLPTAGEKDQTMRWFWEGSHYKPELGAMMRDCLEAPNPKAAEICKRLEADIILP